MSVNTVSAQDKKLTPAEIEYNKNIRKSRINGVYIPQTVTEACKELEAMAKPAALDKFKTAPRDQVVEDQKYRLGKWIAQNWNLHTGSRYGHLLKSYGVSYPDDMVDFTIASFHMYLNELPLDVKKRGKVYEDKRKGDFKKKMEASELLSKKKVEREKQ